MPILKRLNGESDDEPQNRDVQKPRQAEPKIIKGRPGYASFSLAALRERIEAQFEEEIARRTDILLEAQGEESRRQLIREAGEYVLAIESVPLTQAEKDALFDSVYRDMFTFGPLDELLADESVTELTIDGYETIHIRRGTSDLVKVPSHFEDQRHLDRILERIVTSAGVQMQEDDPFLECGLTMLGRPARLSMVGPPLSPVLHVELRLRSHEMAALAGLQGRDIVTPQTVAVLRALLQSPHGLLLVGGIGSGKTTLLEALLPELPTLDGVWLVERAREIRVPGGIRCLQAGTVADKETTLDFAGQITTALAQAPAVLAVDELRGDEALPVWEALTAEDGPRCLFVLRSSTDVRRLHSAFSILLRKGQPDLPQEAIDQVLLARIPFVVMLLAGTEGVRVAHVGEWVESPGGGLTLALLVEDGRQTAYRPRSALVLD